MIAVESRDDLPSCRKITAFEIIGDKIASLDNCGNLCIHTVSESVATQSSAFSELDLFNWSFNLSVKIETGL